MELSIGVVESDDATDDGGADDDDDGWPGRSVVSLYPDTLTSTCTQTTKMMMIMAAVTMAMMWTMAMWPAMMWRATAPSVKRTGERRDGRAGEVRKEREREIE